MTSVDRRFEALAKELAEGSHTRRGALRIGVGFAGALLAAALPGRGWAKDPEDDDGDSPEKSCKRFCKSILPPGPLRRKCIESAEEEKGPCFECGPAAPPGHPALCGTVCCDPGQICVNGQCGCPDVCCPTELGFAGRNPQTCQCACAPQFPVACGQICCPPGQTCSPAPGGGVQCSGEVCDQASQNFCANGLPGVYPPGSTCCARQFDFTCCPPGTLCTPFGDCCCPPGTTCPSGTRPCFC